MNKWVYIEPYIEMTFNKQMNRVMIYNSVNKSITIEDNYMFIKDLSVLNNNEYVVKENKIIEGKEFIDFLRTNFIGGVIENINKPFIPYPQINIQEDLHKFKDFKYRNEARNILKYILELDIYISDVNLLFYKNLKIFFTQITNSSIRRVNFIISDNINIKLLKEFILYIQNPKIQIYITCSFETYNILALKKDIFYFRIIFSENIVNFEKDIEYVFFIENMNDYHKAIHNINNRTLISYSIEMKDYNNKDVINSFLLKKRDDFHTIKKRKIDANKTLNTELFGKLIIRGVLKIKHLYIS